VIRVKFFKDFEHYKRGETYLIGEREATRVFEQACCYNVNPFDIIDQSTFKTMMKDI